jgi:hypothetical protein
MSETPTRGGAALERDVEVVDREGRRSVVSPRDAEEAFRSGQVGFAGNVPVVASDGTYGYVPANEIEAFLAEGGNITTRDAVEQAAFRSRPENQGVLGAARATGEGLVGAVPFVGTSALNAMGVEDEDILRRRREFPVASGLGQLGEVVAEAAGLGAAGRVVGAGARAARGALAGEEVALGAMRATAAAERTAAIAAAGEVDAAATLAAPTAESAANAARALGGNRLARSSAASAAESEALAIREAADAGIAREASRVGSAGEQTLYPFRNQAGETVYATVDDAIANGFIRVPETAQVGSGAMRALPASVESITPSSSLALRNAASMAVMEEAPLSMATRQYVADAVASGNISTARSLLSLAGEEAAVGGIMAAGQAVNDAELYNIPLTAQSLLGMAAAGAVLGGVLGGGAAALGRGASAAGRRLSEEGRALANRFAGDATEDALLDSLANRAAFRALGANKSAINQSLRRDGVRSFEDVGRTLNTYESREGWRGIVDHAGGPEENIRRLDVARSEVGQDISAHMRNMSTVADTSDAWSKIVNSYDTAIGKLNASPLGTNRALAAELRREVDRVFYDTVTDAGGNIVRTRKAAPSLEQMHLLRQQIDDVAFPTSSGSRGAAIEPPKYQQQLINLRGEISQGIDDSLRAVADEIGSPKVYQQWKDLNRTYQNITISRRAAYDHFATLQASRVGGASAAAGAGLGALLATANPGVAAFAVVSGFAADYAKKNINRVIAAGLSGSSRAAALNGIAEAAIKTTKKYTQMLVSGTKGAAKVLARSQYKDIADESYGRLSVSLLAGAPLAASLPQNIEQIRQASPTVAREVEMLAEARALYLRNNLPTRGAKDPALALANVMSAPASVQAQFMERAYVAAHPEEFLKQVANGNISTQAKETIQELYPSYLQMTQEAIMSELSRNPGPVPARVVSVLRSLSSGRSGLSDSKVVVTLQQTYSNGFQTMPQANGRPKAPNVTTSDYVASQADAVSARISGEGPG